jgi:AAA15 family ATPase/GTPase
VTQFKIKTISVSNKEAFMLRDLTVQNYRCFEDFHIDGLERVNLFVGKNNIGKTSLLEAIYLLVSKNKYNSFLEILVNRGEIIQQNNFSEILVRGAIKNNPNFYHLESIKSIFCDYKLEGEHKIIFCDSNNNDLNNHQQYQTTIFFLTYHNKEYRLVILGNNKNNQDERIEFEIGYDGILSANSIVNILLNK